MGRYLSTVPMFKASDGAAAVDMSVKLVGQPIYTVPGRFYSFQPYTPAGPVGTWSIEDTSDPQADPGSVNHHDAAGWNPFPVDSYETTPVQPSGAAVVKEPLLTRATAGYKRLVWTPDDDGSSGVGVLPTAVWVSGEES
jgi:hypothetical protein